MMLVGSNPMRTVLAMAFSLLVLLPAAFAEPPETSTPISAGGHLSKAAINLFLARPLDEVTEVRQNDKLLGKAHILGNVTAELHSSTDAAVIDFHLTGVSRMLDPSSGGTGGFLSQANLESEIDARKSVLVDLDGLSTKPATAKCQASLKKFANLDANDKSFAGKLLQGAERLASRQTEQQVKRRLDSEVEQAIEKASVRLQRQPWLPLDKASRLLEMLVFSSTSQHARAQVFSSPNNELPAPSHVRELDPSYDLHILLHETVIGSLATKWWAGKRIHDHEVLHHVERMRGRAPWALWVHARRPRWSVTLAPERPFSIRFDRDQIHIKLRIDSVNYGGEVLETPIEVTVVVQPDSIGKQHRLQRAAGPKITFVEGDLDPQREIFATMLQHKFDAIFPAETFFDGLKTPSSGAWTKFLQFEMADFSAQQGWFSLAFQLNEPHADNAMASAAEGNVRR